MTPSPLSHHASARARRLLPAAALLLVAASVAVPGLWLRAGLVIAAAVLAWCDWQRQRRRWELAARDIRALFEQHVAPTLIYATADGQLLAANHAAADVLGWEHSQLLRLRVHDICADSDAPTLQRALDHLRGRTDGRDTLLITLQRQDGSTFDAEITGTPLAYADQPARLFTVIDRSVESAAQTERDQAMARLRHAQDIARIINWEYDPKQRLLRLDGNGAQMLDLAPAQAAAGVPLDALLADDPPSQRQLQALADDLHHGATVDCRLVLRLADGRALVAHLRGGGTTAHGDLYGTLQDVSEHERVQRALKQQEHQFSEMMRVLPDAVLIVHGERVIYRNPAADRLFALGTASGQDLPLASLMPATPSVPGEPRCDGKAPGQCALTRTLQRSDGSCFEAIITPSPLRHAGADCVLLVVHDLSHVELARRQLQASNRELQAMARQLFTVQESERQAISRDLHDDIGQAITAMKLSAHAALEESDPLRQREDLQHILQMADQTVGRLRDLSTLLRPPQLDALGLEAAIRWQAGTILRNTGLRLELDVATLSQRPAAESEQACFRIAQESLTNVVRHAHAGEVCLRLVEHAGHWLELEICDDGDGFDADGPRGLGLIVMRERAQSAGGTLQIHTAPGAGTRIHCRLPFTPPALPTHPTPTS